MVAKSASRMTLCPRSSTMSESTSGAMAAKAVLLGLDPIPQSFQVCFDGLRQVPQFLQRHTRLPPASSSSISCDRLRARDSVTACDRISSAFEWAFWNACMRHRVCADSPSGCGTGSPLRAMMAPCSVKAQGRWRGSGCFWGPVTACDRFSGLFKVTNCDLERHTSSASVLLNLNILDLDPIPQSFQVLPNCLLQLRGLGELALQFGYEAGHLLLEGFAVVLDFLGANVAARGEHAVVLLDEFQLGGLAEAGNVLVAGAALPVPEGARDFLDILGREAAQDAVHHEAEFAGVDEQGLARAAAVFAPRFLVPGEQPD